ncbi:MAG: sulfatase-like hydrolase/transferase, partial [Verrucomicrobiota bacterium]
LAVGFVRPHVPLVAPAKYFEMYDRGEMIAPEVPEDDLNDVPAIIRGYKAREAWGVTPELHKGLLEAYYASISYMDAQVGRVMDALDERGLTKKTIIIFTSDHGYLLGEHHKYQKQHLFEESTRVPFIFSVPWMAAQHGQATSRITELVDFFPTVTDLVGFRRPGAIQGSSLLPLLEDPDAEAWAREDAFTISRSGGESVRTEAWRFTHWGWGEKGKELYDRVNDPGEFTNLADHPDFAEVQAQMEERLLRRREAAGFRIDVHAKRKW